MNEDHPPNRKETTMAEELTNGFDKTKSKAHIDACENIQAEIDAMTRETPRRIFETQGSY